MSAIEFDHCQIKQHLHEANWLYRDQSQMPYLSLYESYTCDLTSSKKNHIITQTVYILDVISEFYWTFNFLKFLDRPSSNNNLLLHVVTRYMLSLHPLATVERRLWRLCGPTKLREIGDRADRRPSISSRIINMRHTCTRTARTSRSRSTFDDASSRPRNVTGTNVCGLCPLLFVVMLFRRVSAAGPQMCMLLDVRCCKRRTAIHGLRHHNICPTQRLASIVGNWALVCRPNKIGFGGNQHCSAGLLHHAVHIAGQGAGLHPKSPFQLAFAWRRLLSVNEG